jgi:hypothetical protein
MCTFSTSFFHCYSHMRAFLCACFFSRLLVLLHMRCVFLFICFFFHFLRSHERVKAKKRMQRTSLGLFLWVASISLTVTTSEVCDTTLNGSQIRDCGETPYNHAFKLYPHMPLTFTEVCKLYEIAFKCMSVCDCANLEQSDKDAMEDIRKAFKDNFPEVITVIKVSQRSDVVPDQTQTESTDRTLFHTYIFPCVQITCDLPACPSKINTTSTTKTIIVASVLSGTGLISGLLVYLATRRNPLPRMHFSR